MTCISPLYIKLFNVLLGVQHRPLGTAVARFFFQLRQDPPTDSTFAEGLVHRHATDPGKPIVLADYPAGSHNISLNECDRVKRGDVVFIAFNFHWNLLLIDKHPVADLQGALQLGLRFGQFDDDAIQSRAPGKATLRTNRSRLLPVWPPESSELDIIMIMSNGSKRSP